MIQSRSISRELALLVLGQISDQDEKILKKISLEILLNKALESLISHWTEVLDDSAKSLQYANQHLLDSELNDVDKASISVVRNSLSLCLHQSENVLNGLAASMEIPRLLILGDQEEIKISAVNRVNLVIKRINNIDNSLDKVMEGWRLKRLPKIDRDILRLAVVDLIDLQTPPAVACNEAVDLANRYSDEQGRRMINGVLRRLQNASLSKSL